MQTYSAVLCDGKTRFPSFGEAQKQAKQRVRSGATARLNAYHCRHCNAYHIGGRSPIKRERARPEAFDYGYAD